MELTKLFEVQAGLKQHIGYKGKGKFPKMMLAMLVEFMECANDWRGFKYWSENPNPKETLLEEYVDGLHFVLETGLDLKERQEIMFLPKRMLVDYENIVVKDKYIVMKYKKLVSVTLELEKIVQEGFDYVDYLYIELFENYLKLGYMLGFTEEQIEQAYMKKNEVNHQRQDNGY
ncbi:dUTP diphosphatase [Bacillus sp. XF8]|uniref:dUTP diphosphatase n=1 Tax=Bacillus sp. XF8 TaxID=2819289 RepID=UPI001AA044CF|nr:dUTP diphosphatase [Bacillus sp. XF8]MBO1583026.1 dUTP diphosphatase [Bacillus sp. XF8]